jgi:hypothetical protein
MRPLALSILCRWLCYGENAILLYKPVRTPRRTGFGATDRADFWLGAGARGFLRVISSAADAEGRSGGGVRPHADAVRVLSLTRRVTL